ncbi:tetratricopeptide repeat protein [Membranihabitans marinus]|uniref:tetratricopeptide repeat protein n=1 Tax=Membranihabitans marinus TaxID=1227546 RepID=UPI001F01B8A8|nr:tetratricopeptide repeat protein [Membranihabitans marinus]
MNNYIKISIFSFILWTISLPIYSQNPQLAMHYYSRGEYEKAATIFQELMVKQPRQSIFFERLVDCYNQLREYDKSLELVQQKINQNPNDIISIFLSGNILELKGDDDQADSRYREAIKKSSQQPEMVNQLAQGFQERGKFQYALDTYKEVIDNERSKSNFLFPMASLHYRLGQYDEMIDRYLEAMELRPQSSSFVLNYFQRYLPDDYLNLLEEKVIAKLQESSSEGLNEVLAWTYIQRNDFNMAYRQIRAIDQRKRENGNRLYNLGKQALDADEYQAADRILEYIVQTKGAESPFFYSAYQGLLESKIAQARLKGEDIASIESITDRLINIVDSLGYSSFSAPLIKDIAKAQAFELHNYPEAITTLEKLVTINGLSGNLRSEAKILLADIYLSTGDRWEATLLYSQVDKDQKENIMGQLARYRNAKLSYYMGDFEWAQKQFDILKVATSRLIANDAIDMSVFIIDNMGLDSTDQYLKAYAKADFYHFQNIDNQAFKVLDSLRGGIAQDHNLQDDILYLEAKMYVEAQDYDNALKKFQVIIDDYADDIRADDAIYESAIIYDVKLGDLLKAQKYYEKLFLDYSNSSLAVFARKRYREIKALIEEDKIPQTEEEVNPMEAQPLKNSN